MTLTLVNKGKVEHDFSAEGRFKLGKAKIERVGESPYKRSFEAMSFKPRTVMR